MQEKENIFKLTYLFHSGFAISANGISIIVDYWHDSDSNGKGFVHENILKSQDKVYVLCSHQHHDHFNPDILKWKDVKSDITYVFSSDILNAGLTKADDATYLKEGETFSDDNIFVKAFGSTDIGISFVIERNEKKIFHAGDLNNWHWDEESTEAEIRAAESAFTRKLRKIASEYPEFDLAMFPVDPRLGHNYMKGAMQFVEAIKVKTFAPMHFGIDYKSANKFEDFAKSHGCNFMNITEQGVSINF